MAHNAIDAVALTLESFLKYHRRDHVVVSVHDNASTDGTGAYLRGVADAYTRSDTNRSHGPPLNELCLAAATAYTLVCDSDLEFRRPVLGALKRVLNRDGAVGAAYPSPVPRIDPCCALFLTADLQRLIRRTPLGWEVVTDAPGGFRDTGAALLETATRHGLVVARPDWLTDAVTHFGGLTCYEVVRALPQYAADLEVQREQPARAARMALVRERLRLLRGADNGKL